MGNLPDLLSGILYRERIRSLYRIRQDFAPHSGVSQPKTTLWGWLSSALKCLHFNADIYGGCLPLTRQAEQFLTKIALVPTGRRSENRKILHAFAHRNSDSGNINNQHLDLEALDIYKKLFVQMSIGGNNAQA